MLGRITRPLIFLVVVLLLILGGIWLMTRQRNADLPVAAIEGQQPRIADPDIEQIPTIDIAPPVA